MPISKNRVEWQKRKACDAGVNVGLPMLEFGFQHNQIRAGTVLGGLQLHKFKFGRKLNVTSNCSITKGSQIASRNWPESKVRPIIPQLTDSDTVGIIRVKSPAS